MASTRELERVARAAHRRFKAANKLYEQRVIELQEAATAFAWAKNEEEAAFEAVEAADKVLAVTKGKVTE